MPAGPRVGVSASIFARDASRATYNGRPLLYVEQSMTDWLYEAGALPFLIAAPSGDRLPIDQVDFEQVLEAMDGLVLQGGVDVSPLSYGEEPQRPEWSGDRGRDLYEIALIEAAIELNKPILGICRGCQLLNVFFGGTLYQDIDAQVAGCVAHRNAALYEKNHHAVNFPPGTDLARWFGTTAGTINSVHHQAIKDLAPEAEVLARSDEDDLIEAFRMPGDSRDEPWLVGVQWHPEFQDPRSAELLPTAPLVDAFFRAIRERSA